MTIALAQIIGNLGNDPETRYTPNGRLNVKFSVATNRRWTDQNGQQQERTTWFRVTVWGNQAEGLVKLMDQGYLSKGRQVFVSGRLESNEFTGNDGTLRTSLEITANEVQLVGGRQDSQGGGGQFGGGSTEGQPGGYSGVGRSQGSGIGEKRLDDLPDSGEIDDIPF